jgi:predicted Zn-dependent peptidase
MGYILLSLLLLFTVLIIFNLIRKQERYEEILAEKTDELDSVIIHYSSVLQKIREIDNNEIFEKDDDVGSTFQMLKNAIEEGNEYLIKYYNDDIGSSRNR